MGKKDNRGLSCHPTPAQAMSNSYQSYIQNPFAIYLFLISVTPILVPTIIPAHNSCLKVFFLPLLLPLLCPVGSDLP